jgi:hypothetical protein
MSKNTDLSELINYVKGASTGQLIAPSYTSATSFTGTIAGYLGFDSSGNILTTGSASQWITSGSNIYYNTGSVGIGTSSPIGKLNIVNNGTTSYSNQVFGNSSSTASLALGVGGSAVGATFLQNNAYLINSGNSALILGTNDLERIRIESNGNFTIPWLNQMTQIMNYDNTYRMGTLYQANARTLTFYSCGGDANPSITFNTRIGTGSSSTDYGTERMRINSTGQVLVNTTTSAIGWTPGTPGMNSKAPLFVKANNADTNFDSGAIFVGSTYGVTNNYFNPWTFQNATSNAIVGSIACTATSTTYNTSSDYRLKTDLKSFNGLSILSNIKVYDFEWKINGARQYGVIAHELQEVINYAVTGVKDSNVYQSVDYSMIVPILVKSIQELKSELDTLKQHN